MRRNIFRAAAACAGWVATLGGLAACSDEQTGFVVLGNVATNAPACIAQADGNTQTYLSGLLDVGLRLDYKAILLVGNQLTPRGDKTNLRTETQITTITGAEVALFLEDGSLDREFTVPASGVIAPDQAEQPGFGVVGVTLIPAEAGLELADQLSDRGQRRTRVVEVRVFGTTIGGNDVESSPFSYVIEVCEGCLVNFELEALDSTGVCRLALDQDLTAPCFFGQDESVDCRLCSQSNALCNSL